MSHDVRKTIFEVFVRALSQIILFNRGDKVPDLSGIPDLGLCSCLVFGLGILN